MKKTLSTQQAAKKMGVSFRTLNRWLFRGLIRPSLEFEIGGGRTLWRWTDADIVRGRKVKAAQKPGPKPPPRKKAR
jgi:predicted site-specific integrase-resolvase